MCCEYMDLKKMYIFEKYEICQNYLGKKKQTIKGSASYNIFMKLKYGIK